MEIIEVALPMEAINKEEVRDWLESIGIEIEE